VFGLEGMTRGAPEIHRSTSVADRLKVQRWAPQVSAAPASKWDHLLMDQDDLEKRVAELERQLAEQKRMVRSVTPQEAAGRLGIPDVEFGAATEYYPWSGNRRPRRTFPFVGIALALGVAIFPLYGIVAGFTPMFPSSAMWMSGIMCRSPYHFAYHNEGYVYGRAPGFRGGFQCVSGDSAYHINYFVVSVLQTLLVVLALFGAMTVGVLMWRLLRKPR
jgi:hypothetical protein